MHNDSMNDGTNVNAGERIASVALGVALMAKGLRDRDKLGIAEAFAGAALVVRGATGHCPVYRSLGVNEDEDGESATSSRHDVTSRAATVNARKARKVERTVLIQGERIALYAFWRDFGQLPRFMEHLVSVKVLGNGQSHWIARGPAGRNVEWDAEIVNDIVGERIAWKSIGNPDVPNAGTVTFADAPGGRGTIVKVTLEYEPPGGALGAGVAALFGENPDRQVREDLRKFKQLMETGDITTAARTIGDDATRTFASATQGGR